ncbi:MAG: hypothetical protein J6K14_02930 [Clostridia bacterium]|nr:hypothetical protein [Clostridia bacterium]
MKTKGTRVALLLSLCLLLASLITVLIATAQESTGVLTVKYANGVTETYAEGDVIAPIAVPSDFARVDENGDAFVYTVDEGAQWRFVLDGEALTDLTVTSGMLGKTVSADVAGTLGTKQVYYTIHEKIVDETVPEDMRGEFFIYGYDEASLITYLSRENKGSGAAPEPRYRYLRQRDNEFYITMYEDMYPTKFDPRWGSADKEWGILNQDGTETIMCQDRTWRGTYDASGNPSKVSGDSAKVYFNLNGHTLEIGASGSFHFGSMACTPYSMRLYFYSTEPGAVFSGAKSEAVFYSDDDSTVYVGELESGATEYGKNLSVYGKMVAHVNYGGGVWLWGGRYYQVGANHAFLNISHRLYEAKNCEFYLADQSEAALFFNNGQKAGWSATKSGLKFENCIFYVNQHGTKLLREVASRDKTGIEKEAVWIDEKYPLNFVNCSFYGIPVVQTSNYLNLKYEGETTYSVGSSDNFGTASAPAYISYLANPTKTATLYDILGNPFTVVAACEILPASEVACVQYMNDRTYWQPGAKPFVYDHVVITETERYVESDGEYVGLPAVLEAGGYYPAEGIVYKTKQVFAFIYTTKDGIEGYGLVGATPEETGSTFAMKLGSISDCKITLLSDILLTTNVDFGTKGDVSLDMNGFKITVAKDAAPVGAVHRIGDALNLTLYSSRSGAVYENLSKYPIFSLSHGGKGGSISLGDYEYASNAVYSGQNISFISAGSLFVGNPLNEGLEASAAFKARNLNLIYTGSGAAFVLANEAKLDYVRVAFIPSDKNATPIAIATLATAAADTGCNNCTFYAEDGVRVTAYACLNASGAAAQAATQAQRVGFNNVSFYNVKASVLSPAENVNLAFNGHTGFLTIEELQTFYIGNYPQEQTLAYSSAEFYNGNKLMRVPLWVSALPSQVAKVTFNSGKANLGSVTEDWVIGSTACREDFVLGGIFVYSYGARLVAANSNVLTAGCMNLKPGTMRVNLSWKSGLTLNLWIPKDSSITSVSVSGVKTQIRSTLDYKGDYYLVQTVITPAMLAQKLPLVVQTADREETLQLQLSSYISGLLANPAVSREEKHALYALIELAEEAANKDLGLQAPVGYARQEAALGTKPAPSGSITAIGFDIMNNGTVLSISGTSGTAVTLVTEGGVRFDGVIEDGVCRFENVPVYHLVGTLTLECGAESYTYSVADYKASLEQAFRVRADLLYTYLSCVEKLCAASPDA